MVALSRDEEPLVSCHGGPKGEMVRGEGAKQAASVIDRQEIFYSNYEI